jgi:hypothetical protein
MHKVKSTLTIIAIVCTLNIFAQNKEAKENDTAYTKNTESKSMTEGVSISPSLIRFNVKPGTTQVKTFKVNNNTTRKMKFKLQFQDYGLAEDGITEEVKVPTDKYSLSRYLNLSMNYLELKPGESKVVSINATIPNAEGSFQALWTNLIIDQITERGKLELPNNNSNAIALGINAGIGFVIQVVQNPPNVILNNVEIQKIKFQGGDLVKTKNLIKMEVKNNGDGVGYCLYYLELTNLTTGKVRKFKVNQFGVLPKYTKMIDFSLPTDLNKGKYSCIAVIDFGDVGSLQTAEMEFEIK